MRLRMPGEIPTADRKFLAPNFHINLPFPIANTTATPHPLYPRLRRITANVEDREINLSWPAGNSATEMAAVALGELVRSDFVATSGYDELAVHVNIARKTDTLEQIYGVDRLPRLAALKSIWDPSNVFGYHHPLPTSYP